MPLTCRLSLAHTIMFKKILILLYIAIPCLATGQNNLQVVGIYSMSSGDPQGGNHLYVLDSNKYVIVYFGGAQTGNWTITDDSVLTFTPNYEPNAFVAYGRHNNDLADSIRIHFLGFSDEETFIKTGSPAGPKPLLRRVFNLSPNCFSYPYVFKFKKQSDTISFSSLPYKDNRAIGFIPLIYSFYYDKSYNDLIVYYFKERRDNQPFTAIIRKDGLQFNGHSTSRQTLENAGGDLTFIRELSQSALNPGEIFVNPFYNEYKQDIKQDPDYIFDTVKNAYTNKWNYEAGEEYNLQQDAYNNMNILYPLKKITSFSRTQKTFRIEEKPLFFVNCK